MIKLFLNLTQQKSLIVVEILQIYYIIYYKKVNGFNSFFSFLVLVQMHDERTESFQKESS